MGGVFCFFGRLQPPALLFLGELALGYILEGFVKNKEYDSLRCFSEKGTQLYSRGSIIGYIMLLRFYDHLVGFS